MKRDAAQTIFRTVVVAGAMLGTAGACGGKKPQQATPTNTAPAGTDNATPATPDPCAGKDPCAADPCAGADPCASADPCGGRPRGDDPCGGATGRGFILS